MESIPFLYRFFFIKLHLEKVFIQVKVFTVFVVSIVAEGKFSDKKQVSIIFLVIISDMVKSITISFFTTLHYFKKNFNLEAVRTIA
jgi:hypothetical protein